MISKRIKNKQKKPIRLGGNNEENYLKKKEFSKGIEILKGNQGEIELGMKIPFTQIENSRKSLKVQDSSRR